MRTRRVKGARIAVEGCQRGCELPMNQFILACEHLAKPGRRRSHDGCCQQHLRTVMDANPKLAELDALQVLRLLDTGSADSALSHVARKILDRSQHAGNQFSFVDTSATRFQVLQHEPGFLMDEENLP